MLRGMIRKRLAIVALVLTFALVKESEADGFVSEVLCTGTSLTVVLNQSDPDIQRWLSTPDALPAVYVYAHRARTPCGTMLKNNATGQMTFNLTIPYGRECDVYLTDLEPNYRTAETTIAVEDIAEVGPQKLTRINHAFCLYTRSVQAIRFSDIAPTATVSSVTGGKPKPKVEMVFRNVDGSELRQAFLDDPIEFYIALTPDQAYKGIVPQECFFSDREDIRSPDGKRMSFVQNSCPVRPYVEIIEPLANVNEEVYFSKFRAFRFGNQSTVFVHCTVKMCLEPGECQEPCYKRISNSNLTADKLRLRHKRSTRNEVTSGSMEGRPIIVELSRTIRRVRSLTNNEGQQKIGSRLMIDDREELFTGQFSVVEPNNGARRIVAEKPAEASQRQISSAAVETDPSTDCSGDNASFNLILAALFLALLAAAFSTTTTVFLYNRLRHRHKTDRYDVLGRSIASSVLSSTASSTLSVPSGPTSVSPYPMPRAHVEANNRFRRH